MNIAIRAEHLSKEYRLGVINHGMLYKDLQSWLARKLRRPDPHAKIGSDHFADQPDRFWALKNLDFEIEQGDRIGIIGRNGAGKSTLLKIISRITAPTEGVVKIKGRVVSLLEVGTGFHPELTGRENIFLNGTILGMKRWQIMAKLDEIVSFSEIENFIDTPVKRYSSGMYVRLAFAVAANLESEILLADEVLAVGDAAFQKKCLGKMDAVSKDEGRTILFVSHNMASVRQLCQKGILLEQGRLKSAGNVESVISAYAGKIMKAKSNWDGSAIVQKSDHLHVRSIRLLDKDGQIVQKDVDSRDRVFLSIGFEIWHRDPDLTIGFRLYNSSMVCVFRSLTTDLAVGSVSDFRIGLNNISCEVPLDFLKTDTYSILVDASIYCKGWIIDPERDQDYSVSFNVVNNELSARHAAASPISPAIAWKLS